MRLVFIGGVHGAGKTRLAVGLAKAFGGKQYSAGDLIRQSRGSTRPREKTVSNVAENQQALLSGVNQMPTNQLVFLDGHFSVLTPNAGIEEISPRIFAALQPCLLMVLDVDAHSAGTRLLDRDKIRYSEAILTELRRRESAHAEYVATLLAIPWGIIGQSAPLSSAIAFMEYHVRAWKIDAQ